MNNYTICISNPYFVVASIIPIPMSVWFAIWALHSLNCFSNIRNHIVCLVKNNWMRFVLWSKLQDKQLQMPQTWRPISGGDVDSLKRCLVQFRDLFEASLGPTGRLKFFVGSAEGAPTKCTSRSTRIISSLRGLFMIHQSSALHWIIILYFLIISTEVFFVHKR